MGFDFKTSEKLKYYVYALIDPENGQSFYIGKGVGNRVFDHVACALETHDQSDKYEKIRTIKNKGLEVLHLIIRHGMNERTAYQVESALIDFATWQNKPLTNKTLGHHSIEFGLATANELIRRNNAQPLESMPKDCVIININKTYRRAIGVDAIYTATKEAWVIAPYVVKRLTYVLSEFKGLIVEVYHAKEWYPVDAKDRNGKPTVRWGFNGVVASPEVREKYVNLSVAHLKKRGSTNPIRLNL